MSEKRRHPYLEPGAEWSRWLSTGQAGAHWSRSAGAMRKYIASRTDGADRLEIPGELQARKIGAKWQVRFHESCF